MPGFMINLMDSNLSFSSPLMAVHHGLPRVHHKLNYKVVRDVNILYILGVSATIAHPYRKSCSPGYHSRADSFKMSKNNPNNFFNS